MQLAPGETLVELRTEEAHTAQARSGDLMTDANELSERVARLEPGLFSSRNPWPFCNTPKINSTELTREGPRPIGSSRSWGSCTGHFKPLMNCTKPNQATDEAVDHRPPHWDGRSR